MRRVTDADTQFDASTGEVVEHRHVFGESQRIVEGKDGDVRRHAYPVRPAEDCAWHRNPRREVAVVDEVVFAEQIVS